MEQQKNNARAIQRLTALWGLCESGLGGWMHALKLPMTGVFVGGFAVIIIGMLAWFSGNNARVILRSTLLVLLVKAIASPQSPLPAYFAVAFQGCIGALLFGIIPSFRLAAPIFGILAMLESGAQYILMVTLIYGKSLWEALDKFFADIIKSMHVQGSYSISLWILTIYLSLYGLWGLILGMWIRKLPANIQGQGETIKALFFEHERNIGHEKPQKGLKKHKSKLIQLVFILGFIAAVFMLSGSMSKALYVILRTIAALLLLFLVVGPLLRYLLFKWLNRKKTEHAAEVQSLVNMLPELRSYLRPAYGLASTGNKGLKKYRAFVLILITITLSDPIADE